MQYAIVVTFWRWFVFFFLLLSGILCQRLQRKVEHSIVAFGTLSVWLMLSDLQVVFHVCLYASLSLSMCISAQLLRFPLVCRAAKIHKTVPYLDSWIWDRSYFNFNVQYNLIAKAILDADATSFASTFCNSSLLKPKKHSNFSTVSQESWKKKSFQLLPHLTISNIIFYSHLLWTL